MSAQRLSAPIVTARGLRAPLASAPFALGAVILAFAIQPADQAVISSLTAVVVIVLSAIDIERRIIPNRIVLPATAAILIAQVALFPDRALTCVLAALLAGGVFLVPHLLGRSWLGMGDVKLIVLLGAALGWGVLGAVLLAFTCTLPASLFVIVRRGVAARNASIPFGPFLALGALLILFGPSLLTLAAS
jgi:prepilin signal peptidase PulO-like enzyme (type II secretory pathway)